MNFIRSYLLALLIAGQAIASGLSALETPAPCVLQKNPLCKNIDETFRPQTLKCINKIIRGLNHRKHICITRAEMKMCNILHRARFNMKETPVILLNDIKTILQAVVRCYVEPLFEKTLSIQEKSPTIDSLIEIVWDLNTTQFSQEGLVFLMIQLCSELSYIKLAENPSHFLIEKTPLLHVVCLCHSFLCLLSVGKRDLEKSGMPIERWVGLAYDY
ncbi:uncharacterized protein NEMAJ01_0465 [Nematocida major]|uniref:uncharacterized protein n=1 Tax=Nematocida major TaxID=1912982 RepID=UPI002007B6BF|nr:uncharacterized protein NEMAJ01_0465 [Nematocida major]KAH9385569.1 hypothetical protein NEMAJ01_0465 [Nematocida major]